MLLTAASVPGDKSSSSPSPSSADAAPSFFESVPGSTDSEKRFNVAIIPGRVRRGGSFPETSAAAFWTCDKNTEEEEGCAICIPGA